MEEEKPDRGIEDVAEPQAEETKEEINIETKAEDTAEEKAWNTTEESEKHEKTREKAPSMLSTMLARFKEFTIECKRVLRATKKPNQEEFKTVVKISGLGILAIGLIGFLVHLIKELFF